MYVQSTIIKNKYIYLFTFDVLQSFLIFIKIHLKKKLYRYKISIQIKRKSCVKTN